MKAFFFAHAPFFVKKFLYVAAAKETIDIHIMQKRNIATLTTRNTCFFIQFKNSFHNYRHCRGLGNAGFHTSF